LRLLFLPHETADAILDGLAHALEEVQLGDPLDPRTDIGPVIDADAHAMLVLHLDAMREVAELRAVRAPPSLPGPFFGPAIVELTDMDQLDREVFGPILHVLRYDPADIAAVGARLAAKGFGLTLGVHSRLEGFAEAVRDAVPAGNVYVNRSMIGAVVGVPCLTFFCLRAKERRAAAERAKAVPNVVTLSPLAPAPAYHPGAATLPASAYAAAYPASAHLTAYAIPPPPAYPPMVGNQPPPVYPPPPPPPPAQQW
jgi:hypothetical protein